MDGASSRCLRQLDGSGGKEFCLKIAENLKLQTSSEATLSQESNSIIKSRGEKILCGMDYRLIHSRYLVLTPKEAKNV